MLTGYTSESQFVKNVLKNIKHDKKQDFSHYEIHMSDKWYSALNILIWTA